MVMVSGAKYTWRTITSAVLQESLLDPAWFDIFINNLDDVVECTLSTLVDDTKMEGMADSLED